MRLTTFTDDALGTLVSVGSTGGRELSVIPDVARRQARQAFLAVTDGYRFAHLVRRQHQLHTFLCEDP